VCIADEVQVGFGRFGGKTFWGFQHTHKQTHKQKQRSPTSNNNSATSSATTAAAEEEEQEEEEEEAVVPDIITCGKPFGNGMPLAAVITTDKIANAFENGLECKQEKF
jgi:adenosylmethionine-8-amino-7-oxononanoate aminotransferase